MANKSPDTSGIMRHAKAKSEKAVKRVDAAVKSMIKEGKVINFKTVAKEADVSTTYLYKNTLIKERIIHLRNQQTGGGVMHPPKKKAKLNVSDASKDVIIETLRRRIKRLEEELGELKRQQQLDLSKVYKNL